MSVLAVLFTSFLVLLCLAVPMVFGIGVSGILAVAVKGTVPMVVIPQKLFTGVDSFPLLAVPLFVLAGDLMLHGGVSKRLINLCKVLFGWSRYCLAYVTVGASAFFAAISGSAPATNAAIGSMMYEEMTKTGYDADFAGFLGAAAGTLGPLIPPSIGIVVWATQVNASVGRMFTCASVAGVLLALAYAMAARFTIRKSPTYAVMDKGHKPTWSAFWFAFKDAIWGLISPLIILGGIYSGKFTPTEAAVISVVYSLIIGFFIYKELSVDRLMKTLVGSALTSSMVLLLIAVASLFSWLLTVEGVGAKIGAFVTAYSVNKNAFLAVVLIVYLVLGCFIETVPNIILTAPILYPIAAVMRIDPVHFGIMSVFSLVFGVITPPFGINLFVSAGYSKRSVASMVRAGKYFYLAGISMLMLFAFVPEVYLWAL